MLACHGCNNLNTQDRSKKERLSRSVGELIVKDLDKLLIFNSCLEDVRASAKIDGDQKAEQPGQASADPALRMLIKMIYTIQAWLFQAQIKKEKDSHHLSNDP